MRFSQKKFHLFVFLSSHLPTLRAVDRKPETPPAIAWGEGEPHE